MTPSYNDIYKDQQKRLVRATFKKAFINYVNVTGRTVDVYYAENPQTIVTNIPVAGNVNMATLTVGSRCRVDIFDETNPNDSVMAYTF